MSKGYWVRTRLLPLPLRTRNATWVAVRAAGLVGPFFECGGKACPTEHEGKKGQALCDCHLNLELRCAPLLIVAHM